MLFEKQLQLIFQTVADLFGTSGKVEFFCAVHPEHSEHPILQPLVVILQRQIEDGAFPDRIIPQRLPGADVVSKLGNQKGLANLGRACQEIGSGVEQTVDDRRPDGVGGIVEPVIESLKFQKIFLRNFAGGIDFAFAS